MKVGTWSKFGNGCFVFFDLQVILPLHKDDTALPLWLNFLFPLF